MHQTHPDLIPRLKRAEGHLRGVIAMIEAGKPCLDIAQQLHAVEAALANAKRILIHDHIEHCIAEGATEETAATISDLKAITKFL